MSVPKVLIVAEGRSEIGDLDARWPKRRGRRGRACEGFIPPLLRRLLDLPIEVHAQKVTTLIAPGSRRKLKGEANRAAMALSLASSDGCALLVFLRDVDKTPGVKKTALERRRKIRSMHDEIDAGFAAVSDAARVARVKGTPCRMIEAWVLGDAKAVMSSATKKTTVPPNPEDLWGDDHDPNSNHPKCVLRRVIGKEVSAELFEEIAMATRPETLRVTCPDSFDPFVKEVAAARAKLAKANGK